MFVQSQEEGSEKHRERAIYAGIFLLSAAVLLLQIALTRIFSFSLWYHFAYVTISVALLGYGASGTFLAVFPRLSGPEPLRRLPLYAFACAATIVVALCVFATLPFSPFQLRTAPLRQLVYMVIYYVAVTTPFFFAGLCVSVALKTLSRSVSRLYFFDLAGAGIGCLLVVFVISAFGTPGAVIVAAVIASVAGILFSLAAGRRSLLLSVAAAVAVAVLGAKAATTLQFLPSVEKDLYSFLAEPDRLQSHEYHWSPIFRSDLFALKNEELSRTLSYATWGTSPEWKQRAATAAPKLRMITHDGTAGAVIYNFDGDLAKLEMFDHLILKTPYLLLDRPDVLVIGVGGGTDIVNGVKNGARHVTGVELDPYTIKMVKVDQAEFTGHLYERPDVSVIAGEGRSMVRQSRERYDLIQMTGVDTLSALSTGAYILSESYLYTAEAVGEFLDHLTPDGILCVAGADFTEQNGFPRHSMRQLSLYIEALHRRGIDDPRNHVAVLASAETVPEMVSVLKNSPFTDGDRARLQAFADQMGFAVRALPGADLDTVHSRYLRTPYRELPEFLARYPLNLSATTDDNPFFFNFYQWRYLGRSLGDIDVGHTLATAQIVLATILLGAIVASVGLILLPLFVFQRHGLRTDGKWGFVAFFVGIGLGFIFIEISFIQKFVLFLGYPTYSLTVVLFSLLTYSGIGSFLTGRLKRPPEQRLLPLFVCLAVVSLAYWIGLPALFDAFLGSAFPVRVVIASAMLVPLGLIMGMFFPTGIEIVRRGNVDFVPWAWGINGCASVVGAVLSVVVAMNYGFRVVTAIALAVYLVAVIGLRAAAAKLPA